MSLSDKNTGYKMDHKLLNSDINKIRLFSDLHLDFDYGYNQKNFTVDKLWYPEKLPDDKNTLLILAGDIWHSKKGFKFMNFSWYKEIASRFKYVLLVLGNHDYWYGNIDNEAINVKKNIQEQQINNMFLLQNDIVEFNNIKFYGGTLWLNYFNKHHVVMDFFSKYSNDLKFIREGYSYKKTSPKKIIEEFNKTYLFLQNNLLNSQSFVSDNEKQQWVITHHPPSPNATHNTYQELISAFVSKWEEFDLATQAKYELSKEFEQIADYYLSYSNIEHILKQKLINVWVHGHTHEHYFKTIHKTQFISNARGYVGEQQNYKSSLLINSYGQPIF